MKHLFLLSYILVGFIQNAHANFSTGGGQFGNGGDAVICQRNYQLTAELLDVFEGRILHKMELQFPVANWVGEYNRNRVIQANAHGLARRIETFSPLIAKRYHEYINSFFDDANFVSGVELVDIPDSNAVLLPVDCKVAQLIVQISDGSYGSKRYIINQDIWDLLDDHNKVAAVFHEVVYRFAIETGQADSRWTRYFNAIVFSDQISSMTLEQFAKLRKQAYNNSFSYQGFELSGNAKPGQKFFQILSAPTSETLNLKLDDGLFDMEKGFMIEAHFSDVTPSLKGLIFPKGLSMTFGQPRIM